MNIQRFTAPTAREALAKARLAFGDGTLILSNRPTATGVEVVATAEETLAALDHADSFTNRAKAQTLPRRQPAPSAPESTNQVEDDVAQLSMSTLSFQDYVRERMLRRRHEALTGQNEAAATEEVALPRPVTEHARIAPLQFETRPQTQAVTVRKSPAIVTPTHAPAMSQGIVDELHAMKALIEDRFNTLTWLGQARQNPIQSNLMLKLIRAGYSPTLARTILERMPEEIGAAESVRWVMDVLERNLKTDAASRPLHEEGGTYALVGATGVGKTTTAAKLAGLCARKHGPGSVGLITLDTYRVGAHEQLRSYGRMLGVVAHLAHDRAALQDLLNLLGNKKMILIDTTGLAPNDPRKRGMLDVLDLPGVNRLLVLNAGGHGDTLDDVVSSFKSTGVQQAVLSKIDEAAKLGPALDAAIRHQLVLRGVTMGQKVPEDWESADATKLIRMSMRSPARSAFDPTAADLGFFFTQSSPSHSGRLDA
ncbi:flagellar biosynthesis protein FlhF [Rhodoferax ferrireducens]|uniref:flagellar biosynthesis protein FlhF n=1 Tax=Rhodoferax ferrireducens TaxID=192843 RepID=UPI000E0E01AC|nr:flagellar biosynthesis protein FlhF [Rhodoferax ferrireducens]